LELFRELGVVNQMDFSEGVSRYEYSDWEHHHHLVCLKCGTVIEFSNNELEAVELELAQKYDFEVIGHRMKLFGYCRQCRDKRKEQRQQE
jgi:Fur family ferric uptake transcriptional regulator